MPQVLFNNKIYNLSQCEVSDLISPQHIVDSWKGIFRYKEGYISAEGDIIEPGLRKPQIGALHAFMADNQKDDEAAIIVMPTGTGKTETMLAIMIASCCQKLLVVVPSDALRTQVADKFISLGLLPGIDVLDGIYLKPIVGVVKKSMDLAQWQEFSSKCNVVVTTMNILGSSHKSVKHYLSNIFSNVFIDEAHHIEAKSWGEFASNFNQDKLTLFTATPYRNDGKKLRGKIIYNFSLREAQAQNYYKPINLRPLYAYTQDESDRLISEAAISQLKVDLKNGYNHILMARCKDKTRAEEVFRFYANEKDLNPVIIHSGIKGKREILDQIKTGYHKIIVCVNMLGEGYDLPTLKIAALHDSRKSLPVMLQFIGRFTRTSMTSKLGNATFIVNVADPPTLAELEQLYRQDADWNYLLPRISEGIIEEDITMRQFMAGFSQDAMDQISIDNITPACSTLVYKVGDTWSPKNCFETLKLDAWKYVKRIENSDGNTLILLLGREMFPDWTTQDATGSVQWEIIIVHHQVTPKYCHGYIHTSTKSIHTDRLMRAIFGDNASLIAGNDLFRVFYDFRRMGITMFGGRKSMPGTISFKSFCGRDVEDGISQIEAGQLIRNNVFGIGFKNGRKDSIGCTIRGKIWSLRRENIYGLIKWFHNVGALIEDNDINPNLVMEHALKVKRIKQLPNSVPIAVDWHDSVWQDYSNNFYITDIVSTKLPWHEVSLEPVFSSSKEYLELVVKYGDLRPVYRFTFTGKNMDEIKCTQISGPQSYRVRGSALMDLVDYFNDINCVPSFFFANGDILQGNYLAEIRTPIPEINQSQIIPLDWKDTLLNKESQYALTNPEEYRSIQYFFGQYLLANEQFDIMFNDDGAGEIADLVTIREDERSIKIGLYHLKYASEGKVCNEIKNLYEVCCQAIRSLKWHNKELAKVFFNHLLDRKLKKLNGHSALRILKGDEQDLIRLSETARYKKKLIFDIYIVQPSISAINASEEIRLLLGCVGNYIEDVSNITLKVYTSP